MNPDTRGGAATPDVARGRAFSGGGALRGILSRHRGSIAVGAILALVATVSIGRFLTASVDTNQQQTLAIAPTSDSAIAALESVVAERPDDGRAWQQLGAAYVEKVVQTGDPAYAELAERSFDQADARLTGDVSTTVARAQLALTQHQFGTARELALQANDHAFANNDALLVLVDADIELGNYDQAATNLQKLLDRKPGFAAHTRVSYLRELHGDVDGALLALRDAENAAIGASDFDVATVSAIRGDLLLNHGRVDEAAGAYSDALQRVPEHLVARAGMARVAVANGDLDGAQDAIGRIANVTPTPAVLALVGEIAVVAGRTDDAARAFELVRATTALAEASGAAVDLEAALFEADHGGDPAATLAMAEAAYAEQPSIHGADALAWARYRTGDFAGAANAIGEALRLGTKDAGLLFHAAAIHAASGQTEQARRELTAALTINPHFAIGNRREVLELAGQLAVEPPQGWVS